MGVLAVGALAVGVSVYAAPRETRGTIKSDANRLVTSVANEELQAVVDGGVAGVAPSFVGIKNDHMGLSGAPVQLYFEIELGGWVDTLDTWQVTVDQATFANGVGAALAKPVLACTDAPECEAAYGPGSKCAGGVCDCGYQDAANADFAINGISAVSQPNLAFGSTKLPGFSGESDDGRVWYGGDLVLEGIGLKGTYVIDILATAATFLVTNESGEIAIVTFNSATVEVPTGRCCLVGTGDPVPCMGVGGIGDVAVTKSDCDDQGGLFGENQDCTTACIECEYGEPGADDQCDDGDACTTEVCLPTNFCDRDVIYDTATECCDGDTATITALDDGDDCTDDACDGAGACQNRPAGSCGADVHPYSSAGTDCNDDNACTFDDICDGAGLCEGTDANTVPCNSNNDCLVATGGALECNLDTKLCFCTLSPAITFVIDPGDAVDPNCFDDGEKILATVHIGPSLDVITAGQVNVVYDPSCMEFNNVVLLAPFVNILFIDMSVPGEIFLAVGIDLGTLGVGGGNFDLVAFSFNKTGGCESCNLCFTDDNPRHTRLVNDVGQAVTTQPECSKDVRGDGVLKMETPPGGQYNSECDKPARDVAWENPTAWDTCELTEFWCGGLWQNPYTGEIVDVGDIGVDPYKGGRFPIGDATFCCNAMNDCMETLRECWTVTVNDETSLDVDLQMSPTMAGVPGDDPLVRCIKFELFSNCMQPPLIFSENVSFGGLFDLVGKAQTQVKIPTAGQFGCITARDQLHTLRSCYTFTAEDCDVDGVLHATFKGDPFFGGNWLVGGNLDGFKKDSATASLDVIDITDFGMFVADYPHDYGTGNTPCGTDGPHADINGDGMVDLFDFTFVSINYLESSKDCCCPGSTAAPVARTSISVRALIADGQGDLAKADLNGDGFVDMTDITLFMNGQTPTKGPVRSRTGR